MAGISCSSKARRYAFLVPMAALLGLSACSLGDLTPRGGEKADSSEQLLQAEGSWAMVEENSGTDPAQLHSQAKTQVNPNNLSHRQFLPDEDLKMARNEKAADGQDVNYRLIRVERDVQSLRDDFKKLLPPLSNLIVADKNLDQTIADIEAKNAIEPAAGAVTPHAAAMPKAMAAPMRMAGAQPVSAPKATPAPMVQEKPAVTMASAAVGGGSAVNNLRLGEHPGKTRLVLDLTGPSTYRTDLDNNEKLLLVQIPKASWSAEQRKSLSGHPLVAGYTAQPGVDGGTTLAIELRKPVKIGANSALPPNATYQNHRIFIDLAAL